MDVYLMRHGEAAEADRDGDAARPLTPRGHAQVLVSAQALRRMGVVVNAVWHSPYRRTRETAAVVRTVLPAPLCEDDGLVPGGDPDAVARALFVGARKQQGLLVVSHLPLLPAVVQVLTGGRIHLGTASIAHLVLVGGTGVLAGLWSADSLEHLS